MTAAPSRAEYAAADREPTPLYDALLAEQIERQIRELTGPSRWARFVAAFRRWAQ